MVTKIQGTDESIIKVALPPQVLPGFWPEGWWKLMEYRIGIIPLPVYLLLLITLAAFVLLNKVSGDISMVIAIMMVGGFTLAEIGKRIPVLRSIGGAAILHQDQGDMFAQILPPVMLGSLMAILLAGLLNHVGKRYPHLTGEGRLQPGLHDDDMGTQQEESAGNIDVSHTAAAGIMSISLYLLGVLCFNLFGLPAPVAMLFIALVVKLTHAVSPKLQEGAYVVYKFFRIAVVYPLLFAVGVAITPWDKLIAAFHPANIITIFATVSTLMATGFVVGRWMKMYPIETAII